MAKPSTSSLLRGASGLPVELVEPGTLDYPQAWALQKSLASERAAGSRPDALILLEHPETFTRGTTARGKPAGPLPHPVFDVERGGDITYHGPGQLVGYPILHLGERGLKVGDYLRALEGTLIAALAGWGLAADRIPGLTGVWCRGGKVASIGVAVKRWVSYHGFALNLSGGPERFAAIRPCGLDASAMSSLERLLGRGVSREEARDKVLTAFLERF